MVTIIGVILRALGSPLDAKLDTVLPRLRIEYQREPSRAAVPVALSTAPL